MPIEIAFKCLTCDFWISPNETMGVCHLDKHPSTLKPAAYGCSRHSSLIQIGGGSSPHNSLNGLNTGDYRHVTAAELAVVVGLPDEFTAIDAAFANNDAEHASLAADITTRQTAAQVDARIADVIGTAPANLDTLGEISVQMADDQDAVAALVAVVATKADAGHGHAIADTAGLQAALDGKCAGNDSRLSDARTPTSHTHPYDPVGSAATAQSNAIAASATAAQGVLAASALQPGAAVTTLAVGTVGVGQVVTNVGGVLVGTTPGGGSSPAWHGVVYGAYGGCDPQEVVYLATCGGSVGLTPTNLSITVARIAYFRPPANITLNKIRFFGVGVTTNVFRVAIYNADTLARLTAELPFSTALQTWGSAGSALNLTLTAGQLYFVAIGANAVGTTAGPLCFSPTVAATSGQMGVLPKSWPGSLDIDLGFIRGAFAQFAVTTGALPATAPTIASQAAWTSGFPLFILDSNNA